MFPAEPLPDTIGSYKVVRRLPGAGGAEVYLARSQGPMGFARECELKLMPDTSEGNTGFAEQLAREAAICARMNHPAVVRVFDFFEHHGKLVLALEHVEGTTLAELVQHLYDTPHRLGDAAIFYLGARIAGALADAHAAKDENGDATPIIHRNLSPESVLVSVEGEVRLTGFGVGKILGRTPDTAFGRIKGTPGYMAPEQARGEPVTTKADVYGLGLLLWSLLAGKRPPTDGTWPRRISGLRTDLPKEVAAIVDAALDHFPGTRKITAREMEQWLTKAAPPAKGKAELRERVATLRTETGAKDAEPPPPPSSRRRISTAASPYQGVHFGPVPTSPQAPAARVAPTKPAVPVRTATVTGVGMPVASAAATVALNLPPVPPVDPTPAPPVRFGPPPEPVRFGPPPDLTPAPPPVAHAATSATPGPAAAVPQLTPPPPRAPMPTTPGLAPMTLAPVLPRAPPPAPPSAEPPPTPIRFGAPPPAPPAASPAPPPLEPPPPTIRVGPPPAATPPPPIYDGASRQPTPAPSPAAFTSPFAPQPAPPPPRLSIPDPPPRRPPLPSLLTIGPGRRSLSTFGTMLVSAFTATVVVSVALYAFVRRDKGPAAAASASAATAITPPPSAPPTLVPAAASPSSSAIAGSNASDLPYGYGYLTVASPANANVYVSGKLAGPVNKPLKVRCGRWFIRLAAPQEGGRYPEWVSGGETVVVACQESTRPRDGAAPPLRRRPSHPLNHT